MNLWRSNPFLGSAAPGSVPIFPWAPASPSAPAPTAPKPEEPKEIDELRRRMEELEKQLKVASAKRKPGKKK
jgi:hypothetical protein